MCMLRGQVHHVSLVGLLLLSGMVGCSSDQSTEDPDRSYFDGGPLRSPEPNTLVLTGRVLSSQGRTSEAEYVLDRVIAEYPRFGPGYVELGEVLMKDGRTLEAISVMERGVAALPQYPVLRNDLGMCYLFADRLEDAQEQFTAARQLNPGEATYTTNLAMTLALKGDEDAALALYSEVLPMEQAQANIAALADAAENRGEQVRVRGDDTE